MSPRGARATGSPELGVGSRVKGVGCKVYGPGFGAWGLKLLFRVQGVGFRVPNEILATPGSVSECWVCGSGGREYGEACTLKSVESRV